MTEEKSCLIIKEVLIVYLLPMRIDITDGDELRISMYIILNLYYYGLKLE